MTTTQQQCNKEMDNRDLMNNRLYLINNKNRWIVTKSNCMYSMEKKPNVNYWFPVLANEGSKPEKLTGYLWKTLSTRTSAIVD